MLRVLCAFSALFAVMAVAPAHAQPKACKKVDVSFTCRDGGSGKTTMPCRGGETIAQCCARLRKKAADPRRGWCTGRNGGLLSFKCDCSKKGGAGNRERRLAPRSPGAKPDDPAWPKKIFWSGSGKSRKKGEAGACRKIRYKFSCRRRGGAEGTAACRRGEGKAACCERIAQIARRSCASNGGLAKFECDCGKKGGGDAGRVERRLAPLEPGLRREERGETDGPRGHERDEEREPGLRRVRPTDRGGRGSSPLTRRNCARVEFSYSCRREEKEGGRRCRQNESERACCAHAFSVETRNCGRPPEDWECDCVKRSSRPRNRLERIR